MTEPSLDRPPVYRQFLSGGTDQFRLSGSALVLLLVCGAGLTSISWMTSVRGGVPRIVQLPAVAAGTLAAVLIAATAARWLGSRVGVLAGLVQMTSFCWLLEVRSADGDAPFCAAVTAAMGAFAWANVPGRLPLRSQRWIRWAFFGAAGISFLLAGPVGPSFILAGCGLFLAISQDGRGLRFLVDPTGLAIFILLAVGQPVAARLVGAGIWGAAQGQLVGASVVGAQHGWQESLLQVLGWVVVGSLPWTPLALVALVSGLRQGHYATPIWRFLGCWTLAPLVLVACGLFRDQPHAGAILPPLAVISAVGLSGLLRWCRGSSRRLRFSRRQSLSTLAE